MPPKTAGSLLDVTKVEFMLFTKPCCQVLKQCLESGDDRTFHILGDDTGPLMVRTSSLLYKTRDGNERQLHEQAVLFCPFCGTQLQTPEAVERYIRGG